MLVNGVYGRKMPAAKRLIPLPSDLLMTHKGTFFDPDGIHFMEHDTLDGLLSYLLRAPYSHALSGYVYRSWPLRIIFTITHEMLAKLLASWLNVAAGINGS